MTDPDRALQDALGHDFNDITLLELALTHPSAAAESDGVESNQRLEFLGDAVLGLVVSTELHEAWDMAEGEMSKVRAAVVNEPTLAAVARAIGIGAALRLGKGEEDHGGRGKSPILADALEATIGAVFLDAGLEAARRVVLTRWRPIIAERAASPGERDYKTRLQEVLAREAAVPHYEVAGTGPDHERVFRALVRVGEDVLGEGTGTSKKRAQQAAARAALEARGVADA